MSPMVAPFPAITPASLTSFDWLLICIVLLSTLAAFARGIIKVLFSLTGLIIGLLVASWNYLALSQSLQRWITNVAAAQLIAFFSLLCLIVLLFTIAGALLRKTVAAIGLGVFDRLLGAVFGLLRGLLLGVVTMMAIAVFAPRSTWVHESQLAPYFLAGAHAVSFVVPRHFQEQLTTGATHLLQQSPELFRSRHLTQPR